MRWSARRERFRSLLESNSCFFPASVFDPISARIALDLGYESAMFAGSIGSMTVLGAPDLIVLTLSEFAEQAYRISRAADLPLMVDADHGYGNALNAMRTVSELEAAGVAALTIEDTLLPAAFGSTGKSALISREEGVGKMKAALSGRADHRLVVIGRTSAPSVTGLDDAISRVQAYEAAGVDAIFLVGLRKREELEAISSTVKLPIMLGNAPEGLRDRDLLARYRVRICLQGHQPFSAATAAIYDTLRAQREGTPLPKLASAELLNQLNSSRRVRPLGQGVPELSHGAAFLFGGIQESAMLLLAFAVYYRQAGP